MSTRVVLYDTTLRDGAQGNGVSFSVEAKLTALRLLDELGVPYVEGGWPGANPTDTAFFLRARDIPLRSARLVAFGSTRRAHARSEDDLGLQALLHSGAPVCALVGKAGLRRRVEELGVSVPTEQFLCQLALAVKDGEALGIRYESGPEAFRELVWRLQALDSSARRPAHGPTTEQVHVQVRHSVVRVTTGVDHQPIA
jgi:2-isopropylmalate synthase